MRSPAAAGLSVPGAAPSLPASRSLICTRQSIQLVREKSSRQILLCMRMLTLYPKRQPASTNRGSHYFPLHAVAHCQENR